MNDPVVILASLNGVDLAGSRHKPGSPGEVAADAIDCIAAGASVIHNHVDLVRASGEASADRYLEGWRPILDRFPDALLYPTSNWAADGTTNFDHIEPLAKSGALRLAFNDVGSPEMGSFAGDELVGTRVYANSFDAVSDRFDRHRRLGLGTTIHILGLSGLRDVMRRHHAGLLPPACWLSLYFSPAPTGADRWPNFMVLPALTSALDLCVEMIGGALPWTASLWGGDLVRSGLGRAALERGGHLSVGLEQYRGERQPRNAELVDEAAALCRSMGRDVASAAEAAELIGLPGR